MSDEKQDSTPPSASGDFRDKGVKGAPKEKKHEVEPPQKLSPIVDIVPTPIPGIIILGM